MSTSQGGFAGGAAQTPVLSQQSNFLRTPTTFSLEAAGKPQQYPFATDFRSNGHVRSAFEARSRLGRHPLAGSCLDAFLSTAEQCPGGLQALCSVSSSSSNGLVRALEGYGAVAELLAERDGGAGGGGGFPHGWEEDAALARGGVYSKPTYDARIAQQLYKSGDYAAHYCYVARFGEDYQNAESLKKSQQQQMRAAGHRGQPTVLMVAEKPSIARVIAEHLGGNRARPKRGCISRAVQTFEFSAQLPASIQAQIPGGAHNYGRFIVTSTIGHCFGLTFKQQKGLRPAEMFWAEVEKEVEEGTRKARVLEHLAALAGEADYLVLWLDCDREGENICYEVISVCREHMASGEGCSDEHIFRAHFSALTESEIRGAFANLRRPNKFLSLSVDARQELDLKVGCSFTRMLTREFLSNAQMKFPRSELKVLSYGPCQTPTLYFCVQRHKEIRDFRSEPWEQMQFSFGGVVLVY